MRTIAAFVAILFAVASASHAEFVRNGGFEVGGNIIDFKAMGKPEAFKNYEVPAEWYSFSPHGARAYVHSGAHEGEDCWYTFGWYNLQQHISGLKPGHTYTVSFYGRGTHPTQRPRLTFYWNKEVAFDMKPVDAPRRWSHYSGTFTITEPEVTGGVLRLWSKQSGVHRSYFDDISLVTGAVMNIDEGWNVRLAAARALASMKGPRAIAGLIAAIKDNEERLEVRREAASGLGLMGADAVRPLISLLGEDISTDFARLRAQLIDRDFKKRKAAAEGLLRLGHAIIPLAKKAIAETDDPEVRLTLSDIIQKISRTKGGVFLMRAAAAKALGNIGDARAMEPLIGSLKDNRFEVRREAAEALGKIKNTRAIEALIASLEDTQSSVQANSAQALAGFKDPRCTEPLLEALNDEAPEVRYWAVRGVAPLKDDRCFEPLVEALKDENAEVRQAAVEGLAMLGADAIEPLIMEALHEKDPIVMEVIAKAFVRIGTPAVEALLEALADDNWQVRRAAAEALGRIGDTRATKPLVNIMEVKDNNVRPVAIQALGRIKEAGAAGAVVEVLGDQLQDVSTGAFVGMGEGAIAPLLEAVQKHESRRVRRGAAEVLGVIGNPAAVDALVGALKDEHLRVRKSAVLALALLEDARAGEGLIEILKDESQRLRTQEDDDEEQPGEAG
ncbi:MAG: HEAT repeat domain-containing protein, partial [Phycisphaerae bacterium]|nr:HEAT repeat domain-containing protein [Phycisphaerae bacterium]